MACSYCDFDRWPELKHIELYICSDQSGNKHYELNIERPEGFIPEPWRNYALVVYYCPVCGRKLCAS